MKVGAYCGLTAQPKEEELFPEGMIAVKSISLTIMYVVPCSYMIITNASMAVMLYKQQRRAVENITRSYSTNCIKRKNKRTVHFILISLVCMTFYLPQPILDLVMAVEIHNNMQAAYENYISVFLNALLVNCTTLVYTLSTIVAIRF